MAGYRGANDVSEREDDGLELGNNQFEHQQAEQAGALLLAGRNASVPLIKSDPRLLVTVAYFAPQVLASIIVLSLFYWSDTPDCTKNRLKDWSIWAALRMFGSICHGLFANIYRAKMSEDRNFRIRVETVGWLLSIYGGAWFVKAHVELVRMEFYNHCHPVASPTYSLFIALFALNYAQLLFPYMVALVATLAPNFWSRLQLLLLLDEN